MKFFSKNIIITKNNLSRFILTIKTSEIKNLFYMIHRNLRKFLLVSKKKDLFLGFQREKFILHHSWLAFYYSKENNRPCIFPQYFEIFFFFNSFTEYQKIARFSSRSDKYFSFFLMSSALFIF